MTRRRWSFEGGIYAGTRSSAHHTRQRSHWSCPDSGRVTFALPDNPRTFRPPSLIVRRESDGLFDEETFPDLHRCWINMTIKLRPGSDAPCDRHWPGATKSRRETKVVVWSSCMRWVDAPTLPWIDSSETFLWSLVRDTLSLRLWANPFKSFSAPPYGVNNDSPTLHVSAQTCCTQKTLRWVRGQPCYPLQAKPGDLLLNEKE